MSARHSTAATARWLVLLFGLALAGCADSDTVDRGEAPAKPETQGTAAGGSALPGNFAGIVESQGQAVVNISTTKRVERGGPQLPERFEDTPMEPFFRRFFGAPGGQQQREVHSLGSGFVVSSDGHIVTNAHVIKDASEIVVQFNDRRQLKAEVLGKDMATDLALLKVDAEDLPTVTWSNGSDLRVGEWVLAMGAPFGFENSATAGIVSAKGRSIPGKAGGYVPFLQTDVAINPGSSGGPLFNTDGEVVGVNAQIYSRSGGYMGLSFAIPAEVAQDVVAQIKEDGDVRHGYLGVSVQDVNRELADSLGLDTPRGGLINRIMPGSAAAEAGLKTGDVILAVDGESVSTAGDIPPKLGAHEPGEEVTLTLLRDGEEIEQTVTLGSLAQAKNQGGEREAVAVLGMELAPVPAELREKRGLPERGGALVKGLRDGPARAAGLRPGDVLLKLGGEALDGPGEAKQLLAAVESGQRVPVLVQRGERALFVPIRIP